MAQWSGQYSGFTHDTRVQDIERSLRLAIKTSKVSPEVDRNQKLKAIRHLSERLRAARLKALRARISALTEPGSQSLDETKVAHLRTREQKLQAQTAAGILREFGM